MNKHEKDILKLLLIEPFYNQRLLAAKSGYSLGVVNRSIKNLIKQGFLSDDMQPTIQAQDLCKKSKPQRAIILAAGYGMRMVPINTEISKGLLEVHGQPLIERLIEQLHEVDIKEIYVVVGYMKEKYEYLIDAYQVKLIVNMEYASKNNVHSLLKALPYITNAYIVPCDLWCKTNPFNRYELYSWYMVNNKISDGNSIRVNRKFELVTVPTEEKGNRMIGISYLMDEQANFVQNQIKRLSSDKRYDNAFWEEALYENGKMVVCANVISNEDVIEIDTYEQLRNLDIHSEQLQSDAIVEICGALQVSEQEITDITVLKKGMTNRSFLFSCQGQQYIMRIPGEGTDCLINRKQEAEVYKAIQAKDISDDIIAINYENGYKITKYIAGAHNCNPMNWQEVDICMQRLRAFHNMNLQVAHYFDIFGQIQYYEDLWQGQPSVYRDYLQTKKNVFSLKKYIDAQPKAYTLTHIDAVPDNFLLSTSPDGSLKVHLIDWEYAGMQDPHVDIAMFCIYAMYDKVQVDRLISIYFREGCTIELKTKIYCYIAACGLLWSNWCEYKRNLGIEFGEYALKQYRYAKEYFKIVQEYIEEDGKINA